MSTLTIEHIRKAERMIERLGRSPYIIYSAWAPSDCAIHGPHIDRAVIDPTFNPKYHEAFIVHPSWRKEIDRMERCLDVSQWLR